MREFMIGETDLSNQVGRPITCRYHLLIREVPPPVCCESYGLRVTIPETGERAEVPDITLRMERILALGDLVVRGCVTPCTLREVIEDWL